MIKRSNCGTGSSCGIHGYKSLTLQHTPNHRIEIDGLRAFAVLSVVIFHGFPTLVPGGFVGVDVFFVISGFLITSHIFEKLGKGTFSFSDFFQRRIRRIFPALLAVMVASLAFGWFILLSDEFRELGLHVVGGAAFISNFIFASEVGYFDTAAELKPMLHLWSLAVEEQFYILWPLAVWIAWKLNFNLLALTLIIFLASFWVNIAWVEVNPVETFFWPFGRFWELLAGSVLAWFVVARRNCRSDVGYITSVGWLPTKLCSTFQANETRNRASMLGLILLFFSVFWIEKNVPFPSYWALLPVFGTILIIYGGAGTGMVRLFLTNRVSVWFGLISYPLYLWHWPVLSFLHIVEDGTPHRDARIAGVILSVILAWLTYSFLEKPIRFGKYKEPVRTVFLSAFMMVFGSTGFWIYKTDFSDTKTVETVFLRKGIEHQIGSSSRWYEGLDNWLFLGNRYDRTVEKLKLATTPETGEIEYLRSTMTELSIEAAKSNIAVSLLLGPNKSSIYPEYLPAQLEPSKDRYFNVFADTLNAVPELVFHDPTQGLIENKQTQGNLYYRTDTHWNSKGAYLAFRGLINELGLPAPAVSFFPSSKYKGDLVHIARMDNYPLFADDNWEFEFGHDFSLKREVKKSFAVSEAFGAQEVVVNSKPLSDMVVWVAGDSFTTALKPFIEATFREVHYIGHWKDRLKSLSADLVHDTEKPDLVIIVRVERSF